MICNGGYYYDLNKQVGRDIAPQGYPIFVLSCGFSTLITQSKCSTLHPRRMDYQIIYVHKGSLHHIDDNQNEKVLPEGTFLIFKPGEIQNYVMYLEEKPEIYWCHFSGKSANNLLTKYNLSEKKEFHSQPDKKFVILFKLMQNTLQKKPPHYIELCALYFQELIIVASTKILKESPTVVYPSSYNQVIDYMDNHYFENINLNDLAKIGCTNYKTLTNQFLKFQNITPMKYLADIRLERSKELLVQTVLQIKEIASAVGYNDPLYFTKSFSKKYGVSPKQFRETALKDIELD